MHKTQHPSLCNNKINTLQSSEKNSDKVKNIWLH